MADTARSTTVAARALRTLVALLATALPAAACTTEEEAGSETTTPEVTVPPDATDRSYFILPPGNYGGLPTNANSLDQLPLYDGLTPLRGDVDDDDIEELFLPQDFEPIGETVEEDTGRDGVEILYDSFGVPHITGETREDLAFGAGWVTARDRALLLDFGLKASRAAAIDIPGVDAFDLVLEAVPYEPSAQAEELLDEQIDLLVEEFGEEGEEVLADATAYAEGATAYFESTGVQREPVQARDVVAVTAFIGSIFGQGGGAEATNAELLDSLQQALGEDTGQQAWDDVMVIGDPEAPTTLEETFDYGVMTGGEVTGSVPIDAGSVTSVDVLGEGSESGEEAGAGAGSGDGAGSSSTSPSPAPAAAGAATYEAAGPPPHARRRTGCSWTPGPAPTPRPWESWDPSSATTTRRSCSRCTCRDRGSRPRGPRRWAWACTCSWAGPRTTRGA